MMKKINIKSIFKKKIFEITFFSFFLFFSYSFFFFWNISLLNLNSNSIVSKTLNFHKRKNPHPHEQIFTPKFVPFVKNLFIPETHKASKSKIYYPTNYLWIRFFANKKMYSSSLQKKSFHLKAQCTSSDLLLNLYFPLKRFWFWCLRRPTRCFDHIPFRM